jgi:hypothetical protein
MPGIFSLASDVSYGDVLCPTILDLRENRRRILSLQFTLEPFEAEERERKKRKWAGSARHCI